MLNKHGSVLISLYTGGGKTITSINLACKIKLKTLVITHRVVLINQWKDSISQFCTGAKIQILDSKNPLKPDIDFYIINASLIPKKTYTDFKDIGLVIVDEAHLIMAEKLSKCMLRLTPRYVIGLSATPYRTDGLNVLFDLYFGKDKIERKLWHEHKVYQINSSFVPDTELAQNGKINWSTVIESQANNRQRNEFIVKLVVKFADRVFLILCKRVSQANYLLKRLREEGEDATSLIGKQQTFEKTSRILVGTSSKAGVGFDHARLDSLILAADLEQYFIQYLGRIFRRKDVLPMIFDIVDDHPILKKHFRTRRLVYKEHGGEVYDFNKEFPEFGKI